MQSGSVGAAEVAIASINVKGAEAWRAAARRLVLVFRASTADRERPHIPEATYFWRYVSEKQLTDLIERLVCLLLPNGFDQAGLQSAMHAQFVRVRTNIQPLQVGHVNPLGQGMVLRGNKTEGLFFGICRLCIGATHSLPNTGRHTVRLHRSGSTPSIPRPRLHGPSPSIVQQAIVQHRRGRAGAARAQKPDVEGQVQDALLHAAYEWTKRPLLAATEGYPPVAAFKHQPASTPGGHGVPFGNTRGGRLSHGYTTEARGPCRRTTTASSKGKRSRRVSGRAWTRRDGRKWIFCSSTSAAFV